MGGDLPMPAAKPHTSQKQEKTQWDQKLLAGFL
jgi:hypothetical protein